MNRMPYINTSALTDLTAEQQAILSIIIKKDGTLRASKPPLAKRVEVADPASAYGYTLQWTTEADKLQGKAAYVWRMVAFAISPVHQHQCFPVMAFCDLDGTSAERKVLEKELDAFADRIIRCVPPTSQHGTVRWGRALGIIA